MTITRDNRRERFRVSLLVARKGRHGYMCKTVYRLVHWASRRIRQLTSKKRVEQYGAIQLRVLVTSAEGSTARYPIGRKLKTRRWTAKIAAQDEEMPLNLSFWHELSRMNIRQRVVDVCKSIKKKRFTTAKYVGIDLDFNRVAIPKWSTEIDPAETNKALDRLGDQEDFDTDLLYKPMDNFQEALFSTDYPKKIALFRSPITTQQPSRSQPGSNPKKFPRGVSVISGEFLPPMPDHKRLRQTKIEEHFKPRRPVTKNLDTPSKGA